MNKTKPVRWDVIGTDGALYINCGEAGLEIHESAGVRMPDTMYWPRPFSRYAGILQEELRYFANCVRSGEAPQRITPAESRAAVAWMAAATESAQSGSVITF